MNALTRSRPASGRGRRVKFGSVTITAPAPPRASVKRNVELSTQALTRVMKRLGKPGVKLRPKRGVPLYYLDGDDPDVVIRKLNGREQRGTIEGGEFCAFE